MKKIIYLMLSLLLLSSVNVAAQVVIGSQGDAHPGALLELKSTTKGLLLPRISLNNVAMFQLDENTNDTAATAVGMVVYNTNTSVAGGNGAGVYIWNGTKWTPIVGASNIMLTGIPIPNGVYNLTVNGYLSEEINGVTATEIRPYFTATNKTLYLAVVDAAEGLVSWYEAELACKNAGGRLPTLYELAQLQDNYSSYNLRPFYYLSKTEDSDIRAWNWLFDESLVRGITKNGIESYVRCVWSD